MIRPKDPIQAQFSSWDEFQSLLPRSWKEMAAESGLLKGLRKDKDPGNFLHVLMLHLLCGHSLRETSAIAATLGYPEMSDVALLKRLRKSENFLKMLCQSLMAETKGNANQGEYRIRLMDGTDIKEPGQFGTHWRIHFSLCLSPMECDELKLTKTKGAGTGEDFRQFTVVVGDIFVGDRGFCRAGGLRYVAKAGGFFVVRLNTQALRLRREDGSPLDLAALLGTLQRPFECLEVNVLANDEDGHPTMPLRLCAIKKDDAATAYATEELRKTAVRRGEEPLELTKLAAGYVIVVTNLPADKFPLKAVLETYRLRWQVELTFKRMKSLLAVGALPKHTDASSKAWLYGKLLIALLIEKLSSRMGAFSPWGGGEKQKGLRESLVQLQLLAKTGADVGGSYPLAVLPDDVLELD